MGSQRQYLGTGGFSSFLYRQKRDSIVASNGVVGRIVEKIDGTAYDGLPIHSNTGEVYLKMNQEGAIVQARVYNSRDPVVDFDWDHPHANRDGSRFQYGVVHVQSWRKDAKGRWIRDSKNARYMTDDEIKRFGELLKKANPKIRFKP